MEIATTTAASTRDEFLQLLVTQLRNQDPLDPVKQEDFLSQLAQFSMLEGIENLNTSVSNQLAIQNDILKLQQFSQAATLVGRIVSYKSADGKLATGLVDSITVNQNQIQLHIGDQTVGIDGIVEVAARGDLAIAAEETQAAPPS